jgi:hypothetical protein
LTIDGIVVEHRETSAHPHSTTMRPRHTALIATLVLASVSSVARAQRAAPTMSTGAVVVTFGGGTTWVAQEIQWHGTAPSPSGSRATARNAPIAPTRGPTPVDIIGPASGTDAWLAQWQHGGKPEPKDVTITVHRAAGAPAVRYLLHNAVPTRVALNQMDARASQVALMRLTLSAESVTMAIGGE